MEKSSSILRALVCAALLAVIFVSLFLPVVSFNSAEVFSEETKVGYYHPDLAHAGKIKVSVISAIRSCGKDVKLVTELYELEAQKAENSFDAEKLADLQAQTDKMMSEIDGEQDARIQEKLSDKRFLKKVALRAAMYNAKKDSSALAFALVLSTVSLLVLALDIALKLTKLIKAKFEIDDGVAKALVDYRLPIVAFILHMFTVQHFVAKMRGSVSLGSGIVIGLVAMLAFAVVRGIVPVLEAKAVGGEKYKKTLIKQGITLGVLVITVVIALLGMRMSAVMIGDMQRHFPEFYSYTSVGAAKIEPIERMARYSESMSIVVSVIAAIPIISYAALGYMLARAGAVEKTRRKKSRKPVTPLGSFYIGFIFIAVAYVLSIVLFTVESSEKRYEMYEYSQMSVVFNEYKEEPVSEKVKIHDASTHALLTELKSSMTDELKVLNEEYKNTSDKQTKAEIKDDIENTKLEIDAAENQLNRIEACKKSTVIFIIVLASLAVAAELAFKLTKFEAERIASSGKED